MKKGGMSIYSEHVRINDFAIRCFRDMGDGDYIAARMAARAGLSSQFFWAAEQAIEKYLKCILMLNRVPTTKLSHRIEEALALINVKLPFKIVLHDFEQELFDRIADLEADRYLIFSYEYYNKYFLVLDHIVWRLRQYCVPLDLATINSTPCQTVLLDEVARIEQLRLRIDAREDSAIKSGYIPGGKLEKILAKKDDPAYEALVWKNRFFRRGIGRKITYTRGFSFVNAPLTNSPELVDKVAHLMRVPPAVIAAAKAFLASPPPSVKLGRPRVVSRRKIPGNPNAQ